MVVDIGDGGAEEPDEAGLDGRDDEAATLK